MDQTIEMLLRKILENSKNGTEDKSAGNSLDNPERSLKDNQMEGFGEDLEEEPMEDLIGSRMERPMGNYMRTPTGSSMEKPEENVVEKPVGKRCYTVPEVAEILGVSRPSVYGLLKQGDIAYNVVGG